MKPIPTPKYSGSISAQLRKDKAAAASPLALPYLAGYAPSLQQKVRDWLQAGKAAEWLLRKYPQAHAVRSDAALYGYVQQLKGAYLRTASPLGKVMFDSRLSILKQVLGTNSRISRVQGAKLKAKSEIRVAALFREMPEPFLRMIVAHELAHLKEREHDKAFYQLCRHMVPDYFQLEFDLRAYLCLLETTGQPLWG